MKIFRSIFTASILLAAFSLTAQQTIYDTITNGGLQRAYILYVPASYTPGTPAPLVFNFHGYTSTSDQQMWYGDFRSIADTAGFLVVHPMGTTDGSGQPHWNVGWTTPTADDVDFTSALIDSIAASYDINQDRVYSTGMSNGGFMSFHLACNLSNRIAAIASVTGSIVPATLSACNPAHPTPILQIHGDADPTVPYSGGFGWSEPIGSLLVDWAAINNITASPINDSLPDIDPSDGSTVVRTQYLDGDNCVDVVHYKVVGGEHTWPGSVIPLSGTNYDIDASELIWQFFSQYDINGKVGCVLSTGQIEKITPEIYPNPANSLLTINSQELANSRYQILTLDGRLIDSGSVINSRVDISSLETGIYLLKVGESTIRFVKE